MTARRLACAALLLAAVGAAFLPVLENGWAPIDDEKNFLQNPYYRGLGLENLRWMATAHHTGHYIPLTWVTLGLDYLIWGMRPFGYHLTSLLLHAANALLFWGLGLRLLRRALGERTGSLAVEAGALAAALLFAVHPLRVESVAWISERRDVLYGLFSLLAIHLYVSAAETPGRRRWRLIAGSCALYAAALLSKGLAIALPVALVALDVAALHRLPASPGAWLRRELRGVWLEKVPYVALALASLPLTMWAIRYVLVPAEVLSLSSRLAAAAYGLTFYLQKTVVPSPLHLVIPWVPGVDLGHAQYALRAGLFLAGAAALLALARRFPAGIAALVTYTAFVLPVSGLLQAGPQLAAYRYTYVSCLPWALLAGAGVAVGVRGALRRDRAVRFAGIAALAAAVGAGAWGAVVLTRRQVALWHDGLTFSRAAVAGAPTAWQPRYSLAVYALQAGEWDEAARHVRMGLLHNPGAISLINVAGMLFATCPDDAIRDGAEARLYADRAARDTGFRDPWALLTLAAAVAENGDPGRAAVVARDALVIARRSGIDELIGRLETAVEHFDRGRPLRLSPADWRGSSAR